MHVLPQLLHRRAQPRLLAAAQRGDEGQRGLWQPPPWDTGEKSCRASNPNQSDSMKTRPVFQ